MTEQTNSGFNGRNPLFSTLLGKTYFNRNFQADSNDQPTISKSSRSPNNNELFENLMEKYGMMETKKRMDGSILDEMMGYRVCVYENLHL